MDLPKILKTKITRENIVLVGILVILLAIPLTVILLGVRQELRKRAEGVNGWILINNGTEVTNSRNVTLTLTGPTESRSLLSIPQVYAFPDNAPCKAVCQEKGYSDGLCRPKPDFCNCVNGRNTPSGLPCETLGGSACGDDGSKYRCCCYGGSTPPEWAKCNAACQSEGYARGSCDDAHCREATGVKGSSYAALNACWDPGLTGRYVCCCNKTAYPKEPPTSTPTPTPAGQERSCALECTVPKEGDGITVCKLILSDYEQAFLHHTEFDWGTGETTNTADTKGVCPKGGCFYNYCPNYPGTHTVTATFYSVAPSGPGRVQLYYLAATCTDEVTISCTEGTSVVPTIPPQSAMLMMISNYQDFRDSVEEPFASPKQWTLTAGDGLKTVWVKFRKNGGAWTTPVSDSITLTTGAPTLTPTPTPGGPTPTPTPPPGTPTPTPTTPPGGYLKLDLLKVWFMKQEGALGRGHAGSVVLALKQGGSVVLEKEIKLDESGEARDVELPGVEAGTYGAFIYEAGYLTKKLSNVQIRAAGNTLDFTKGGTEYFLVGDFNGDQEVNILDFSIFVKSYGKQGEE